MSPYLLPFLLQQHFRCHKQVLLKGWEWNGGRSKWKGRKKRQRGKVELGFNSRHTLGYQLKERVALPYHPPPPSSLLFFFFSLLFSFFSNWRDNGQIWVSRWGEEWMIKTGERVVPLMKKLGTVVLRPLDGEFKSCTVLSKWLHSYFFHWKILAFTPHPVDLKIT